MWYSHCKNPVLIGSAIMFVVVPNPASAEVFCVTNQYRISGYVYGMPALENIILNGGVPMQNISLCADSCADSGTQIRLSIAITAKSSNKSLVMYFATETNCSQVTAYSKPFAVSMD